MGAADHVTVLHMTCVTICAICSTDCTEPGPVLMRKSNHHGNLRVALHAAIWASEQFSRMLRHLDDSQSCGASLTSTRDSCAESSGVLQVGATV